MLIIARELGRTTVRFTVARMRVTLELYDGGGHAPSNAIWKLGGRVFAIEQAARC